MEIIDFILVFLFILIGVTGTLAYQSYTPEIPDKVYSEEYSGIDNQCESDDFMESMDCINNYVKSIYKYEETSDELNLSLEELKDKGGDCRNWAFLYKELGESLGYYSQTVRIMANSTMAHRIAIISDTEGYVVFDLKDMYEREFP